MTRPRNSQPVPGVPAELAIVELARKLIGLAEEQAAALQRGAATQFDWLVLRRAEVVAQLQLRGAAAATLTGDQREELATLRGTLAQLDAGMDQFVRGRLRTVGDASKKVRRFRRAVSPYLTAGPRVPSYVDKTN